mmetsp:Transcript_26964/g.69775  ORF Transcript_26964/g.69775 Transcript_26964/m.69775 type:complete len:208 (+) Transcript_26964:128-751(+)
MARAVLVLVAAVEAVAGHAVALRGAGDATGGVTGGAEYKPLITPCSNCLGFNQCAETVERQKFFDHYYNRYKDLQQAYEQMYQQCGTGVINKRCLHKVYLSETPTATLRECIYALGPDAVDSAVVCDAAQQRLPEVKDNVYRYHMYKWILDQAAQFCQVIPYDCVNRIQTCGDTESIKACFTECLSSYAVETPVIEMFADHPAMQNS